MRSCIELLLGRAAWDDVGKQRRANVGMARAAIFQEEINGFAEVLEIGPVNDRAALSFRGDQPRPRQDREMGGHSVLRNVQDARHLARRYTVRFVHHYELEGVHARCLRKSRE